MIKDLNNIRHSMITPTHCHLYCCHSHSHSHKLHHQCNHNHRHLHLLHLAVEDQLHHQCHHNHRHPDLLHLAEEDQLHHQCHHNHRHLDLLHQDLEVHLDKEELAEEEGVVEDQDLEQELVGFLQLNHLYSRGLMSFDGETPIKLQDKPPSTL